MSRIARIVYTSYPHHIIQRGNNRQIVFFDDRDRNFYLALLKKYASECGCKVKAYCLMDNHVHILLVPIQRDSLAKTMQKLSLIFTQYTNKKYRRTGRLWESRFHSTPVYKDSYLWAVCRYIEKNPVREKMVKRPVDYRWSSAKANTSDTYQDGIVVPIWKDYLHLDEYVKFLDKNEDEKQIGEIRKATYSGMPAGPDIFIKNISEQLGIVLEKNPRGRPKKNKGQGK